MDRDPTRGLDCTVWLSVPGKVEEVPGSGVARRRDAAGRDSVIPKRIHRVWIGGEMPAEYRHFGEQWRALHPDWDVRDWSELDLGWLQNRREFDEATSPAVKADIARYEIVRRYGGIYADVDFEPLCAFDAMAARTSLLVGEERPGHLNNALFGASPEHPFLEQVVRELPVSWRAQPDGAVTDRTGPAFFTRAFRRWRSTSDDQALVLPRERLYPYSWEQKHLRHAPFPEAFAVHHWALSWRPARRRPLRPPSRRQVRALLTRLERGAGSFRLRGEAVAERFARLVRRPSAGSRRLAPAVPAGPGRLLVRTRHGFPLVVDQDDLDRMPRLVVRRTSDLPGVEFLRRTLEPGDAYLEVGGDDGVRAIAAGWLVSSVGRVDCFEPDDRLRELLRCSVSANESLGMPGPVSIHGTGAEDRAGGYELALPTSSTWEAQLEEVLRAVPEVKVLRIGARVDHPSVWPVIHEAVQLGSIRHLDVLLDDAAAGEAWGALASNVRDLGTLTRGAASVAGVDGRLQPTTVERALQADRVPHLVLSFPRDS
jgi:inositol phosphorylceramide mannosyltransferase catalytic subunit